MIIYVGRRYYCKADSERAHQRRLSGPSSEFYHIEVYLVIFSDMIHININRQSHLYQPVDIVIKDNMILYLLKYERFIAISFVLRCM